MVAAAIEAPWSVTYHDGSGNGFRFWQESENEKVRMHREKEVVRPGGAVRLVYTIETEGENEAV